jgi:hypothetical protein
MIRILALVILCSLGRVAWAGEPAPAVILSSLVDPAKIDKLQGERAANPRLRKMIYWLETARRAGDDPEAVVTSAQKQAGYSGTARADADRESLVRNLTILQRLGCLDGAGMASLRVGKAPKITKGPYAGDIATVDHIIPRSVVPELDEKIYNLEFMPAKVNGRKSDKIGDRQRQLALKWHKLGLLSDAGFQAVATATP